MTLTPASKANRRSYRRRKRRPRRSNQASEQTQLTPNKAQQSETNGELPEVFIYTYTIYKALD
jgi:hypothetical protein